MFQHANVFRAFSQRCLYEDCLKPLPDGKDWELMNLDNTKLYDFALHHDLCAIAPDVVITCQETLEEDDEDMPSLSYRILRQGHVVEETHIGQKAMRMFIKPLDDVVICHRACWNKHQTYPGKPRSKMTCVVCPHVRPPDDPAQGISTSACTMVRGIPGLIDTIVALPPTNVICHKLGFPMVITTENTGDITDYVLRLDNPQIRIGFSCQESPLCALQVQHELVCGKKMRDVILRHAVVDIPSPSMGRLHLRPDDDATPNTIFFLNQKMTYPEATVIYHQQGQSAVAGLFKGNLCKGLWVVPHGLPVQAEKGIPVLNYHRYYLSYFGQAERFQPSEVDWTTSSFRTPLIMHTGECVSVQTKKYTKHTHFLNNLN